MRDSATPPNPFVQGILLPATLLFVAMLNLTLVVAGLKELVVVAVSGINRCDYCLASHSVLAGRAGATQEEIEAARDGRYSAFDERERTALEYAAALTREPLGIDDAFFARVRSHFEEGGVVELSAVAGLFNYFNRFNNALRMPPTA